MDTTSDMHDRGFVRSLHQAYADKTESFFTGLRGIPGDPSRVRIESFGTARTLVADGRGWLNRATLVGDETDGQIDGIVAHFDRAGQRCHVGWNPGNCYRPGTWDDALGRRLLDRGFRPGGFRCVWATRLGPAAERRDERRDDRPPPAISHYGPGDVGRYLDALAVIERPSEAARAKTESGVSYGEGGDRWHHYVGELGGVPCCNATPFANGRFAYFEWAQTATEYRGRGCHAALVRRRLADARAAGCEVAFAVTDVGVPSARNLQRAGFRLAYNDVMLVRDPAPAA